MLKGGVDLTDEELYRLFELALLSKNDALCAELLQDHHEERSRLLQIAVTKGKTELIKHFSVAVDDSNEEQKNE